MILQLLTSPSWLLVLVPQDMQSKSSFQLTRLLTCRGYTAAHNNIPEYQATLPSQMSVMKPALLNSALTSALKPCSTTGIEDGTFHTLVALKPK
jgi:hypothetical protein